MARSVLLHPRVFHPAGERRALVLHGLCSDGATTHRMAEHLAGRGFRVSAPDLRGHGLSPAPTDVSLQAYVGDVALLASGLDLVVGHSWGATILASLLAQPGVARAAVLLDPPLVLDDTAAAALAADLAEEVTPDRSLADFAARVPEWDDQDTFRAWRAAQQVSPRTVRDSILDSSPLDLRSVVGAWTVPTEVVVADPTRGALCRVEDLALAGDRVTVTVAEGSGHSVQREALPTVLAAIDRAIDALG